MTFHYGSVCSGVEAATMAWHPIGWRPAFFSEIEPFPSSVLKHHYGSNMPGKPLGNGIPNLGDMTLFQEWPDYAIDLLVGGTPCQSFSLAGLRAGMADPRGNLMLTYLAIAARYQPRWLVWENVPGVLSSNGGRDFGTFLGGLGELGYGFAYRVIDAQYVRVDGFDRAVPQRRRRVFVVGYLGDWRRAAAVLFDGESLRGGPPPLREAGKDVAGTIDASLGRRRGSGMNPNQITSIVGGGPQGGVVSGTVSSKWAKGSGGPAGDEAYNMIAEASPPLTTRPPRGDNDSRHGLLMPVAPTLRAGGNQTGGDRPPGTDVDTADSLIPITRDVAYTLSAGGERSGRRDEDDANLAALENEFWEVRRLMPVECERLQGMPDGYTHVPWRGKMATDGPRYKAIGNSMAVNAMRWIGRRIDYVETTYRHVA